MSKFLNALAIRLHHPIRARLENVGIFWGAPISINEEPQPQLLSKEYEYVLSLKWSTRVWCKNDTAATEVRNIALTQFSNLIYGDLKQLVRQLPHLVRFGNHAEVQMVVDEIIAITENKDIENSVKWI